MAGRLLYEILSEEQEPFALKSFIRERRRPLQPLAQLRSCGSVKRRPLLSCFALSRNPFFSLRHRVSRKKKKRKGGANAKEGLVSGVVDFLAKKLLARKCNLLVGGLAGVGADEEDNGSSSNVSEEAIEEAIECEVGPVSCRCGLRECPLYDGGAASPPPPASAAGLEREEKAAILSPSSPEVFCEGVAEKEQLSPVSVLDLPFYDDEDASRSRRDGEEDGDDEEDESFEDRLAALDRTKHELLSRICSFERLASEGDGSPEPEESSTARRRMELWKGEDSEVARKTVEADQRGEREDQSWRPELAAELSAAVFSALVYDLAVELCSR